MKMMKRNTNDNEEVYPVKYPLDQNPLKKKVTISNFLHTSPKQCVDWEYQLHFSNYKSKKLDTLFSAKNGSFLLNKV